MGAMTCRRVDSGFVPVTRESVVKVGFPSSKARLRGEERKAISIEIRTSEPGLSNNRIRSWLALRSRSNPNRLGVLVIGNSQVLQRIHGCFLKALLLVFVQQISPQWSAST